MSAAPSLLSVRDLSLSGRLDALSFDVAPGEAFSILGPEGAGKRALALTLLKESAPEDGRILLRGADGEIDLAAQTGRARRAARRRLALVLPDPRAALDPDLTLAASIAEPMRAAGFPVASIAARTAEIATRLGLEAEHLRRWPHAVSDSRLARAVLARGLAAEPAVLVVLDPLGRLDATAQNATLDRLAAAQAQSGAAMLFLTDDFARATRRARRVAVLYAGRIVETASAAALTARPRHPLARALRDGVPAAPIDPVDPPPGCRFHRACPHARPRCALETPLLRALDPERSVACHYAEDFDLSCEKPPAVGAAS